MARKYTRDNRGRFASGGGGATARGGRLRTAGGNKRATQTMKGVKRASPDGAIRATDVGKAKVHNFMSKMVENNQDRYDRAAIARNRFPRAENKTTRLIAAQIRVDGQKRVRSAQPQVQTKPKGVRTVVTPTGQGPAADAATRAKTKAAIRRAGGAKAVETQASQKRIQQGRVMDTMSAKGRGPKTPMQRVNQKITRNDYVRNNPTSVTSTQYSKAVRSSLTLRDAKAFLTTGKPQHTKGSYKSNKAANGIIRNAQKLRAGRK